MNRLILLAVAALLLLGCQDAWFGALEKVGVEKRELLQSRVEKAKAQQGEAEQAYLDALEQFRAVVAFDGGELERVYERLSARYDEADAEARGFTDRIDAIEQVGSALVEEWQAELREYDDATLRARSQAELKQTQARLKVLLAAMRRAQNSFAKPLKRLHDRVLFLKHNLNAQAIGSLKSELPQMEAAVDTLKRDLDAASREADQFLQSLNP
jgi:hypothetical protein